MHKEYREKRYLIIIRIMNQKIRVGSRQKERLDNEESERKGHNNEI